MHSWLQPLQRRHGQPVVLRVCRTGRVLASTLEPAFDGAARRRGLLGRESLAPGSAMIIAPCAGIHTAFMRFPIDVAFVSRAGRVLKVRERLAPFSIAVAPSAFAVIEMPAGALSRADVHPGDEVVLVPGDTTPA